MGEKLQIVGETIGGLMAQADATQQQAPDKFTQLMEGVNQSPWLSWGIAGFAVFAVAIAAIAKLTGNLDKIISFFSKYFGKSGAEQVEQQAAYLRKQLLQQMKTDVALRLEDSLHNLVRVDLEQEEQRHQVGRKKESSVKAERKKFQPFKNFINRGLAVFRNNQDIEPVAPAEKTYNIFHRLDIGGRLLILGEPGAGKTTELLTVAQRLVDAAVEDSDKPVPLIFELSSWTPNAEILTWLGLQLQQSYGVSQKLAEPLVHEWVQKNRLLLLLDGLDELGQHKQIACIEALEDFLAQHPTLSALVCCRREEYEQAEKQLKQLNGAVYLQSIGSQQIQQYLKDLGQKQLWSDIQTNPELLKLAKSPLFLTMLAVAYQGQPIQDIESLFNAYIHKQLYNPNYKGTYQPGEKHSAEKTLHYLGWLANQLQERKETEFLIETLQPDWLEAKQRIKNYKLTVGLAIGLMNGLTVGIAFGRVVGLGFGITFGLGIGLFFGLNAGLSDIQPKEQLKWSFRRSLIFGLGFGLFFGLILGLIVGLNSGLSSGLSSGLAFGLFFGLSSGLSNGLSSKAIEQKRIPNQGIKKSLWNGLIFGLSNGLFFGLSSGLFFGLSSGLVGGMLIGLIGRLGGGLFDAIQHFILRLFLTKNGDTPWNYAQFLEHAARHRFIQRTGGRYRFVHDLLRQHFAEMTPQQQAILAQGGDVTNQANP